MMKDMMQQLRDTAIGAILKAENVESLEAMRIKYLGKKGELTAILKQMGSLSPEERPVMGQIANRLRSDIEEALDQRRKDLEAVRMALKLESETVDVTMPGKDVREGHKHPMYNVLDQIKDIFIGMGFEIVDGPEVELSKYNFTRLNIDESHPSREWTDTFYFKDDSSICLRTQTSPMQVRTMLTRDVPIRMIAPGRVYRKDEVDATHSPMFHQIEGMVIDKGMGCPTCKGEGWIEILGAGMVHPKVLAGCGIDPDVYSGWAFGMGLERLAMGEYKITDLRLIFENDVRFLEQF